MMLPSAESSECNGDGVEDVLDTIHVKNPLFACKDKEKSRKFHTFG
jgi:hypothetical protein